MLREQVRKSKRLGSTFRLGHRPSHPSFALGPLCRRFRMPRCASRAPRRSGAGGFGADRRAARGALNPESDPGFLPPLPSCHSLPTAPSCHSLRAIALRHPIPQRPAPIRRRGRIGRAGRLPGARHFGPRRRLALSARSQNAPVLAARPPLGCDSAARAIKRARRRRPAKGAPAQRAAKTAGFAGFFPSRGRALGCAPTQPSAA